jgi:hypothetical protein
MHEVFLKAIAYYKKKLHIRLRFDENEVILFHFLNIPAPGCQMCSLKLSHADGRWGCKYFPQSYLSNSCAVLPALHTQIPACITNRNVIF